MKSLRVIDVLSESRLFARGHRLRLPKAGDVFSLAARHDGGRFGEVWSAQGPDTRPGEPSIAIKAIEEPPSPADSIAALHRALDGAADPEWVQLLLALPFSICRAEVAGDEQEATFMLDLTALGYESAKTHFEEPHAQDYRERPAHERVEFAHSYARGAAVLEAIGFLHGDQNIPNLMLNPHTLDTQIVDFDLGAVLVTGRERAHTVGKPDDCVPPEVKVPAPTGVTVDKARWDAGAERWAVGSLVGYLTLGFSPSFFLPIVSARVVAAYAGEGPWPAIDVSRLAPGGEAAYRYWRPHAEAAPGRVVETFGEFFRAGTRGDARPTAEDWIEALDAARRKPEFRSLEVAPLVVPEGTEVVISWEAEGADRVESALLGTLPAAGEERIVVDRTTRYTLTAVNFYGEVEGATEVVRAVPLPRLATIPMADFPGLELTPTIATAPPARPAPPAPPRLTRALGVPPVAPVPLRAPRPLPAPPHFGVLFKPTPVSRRIRTMMRKEPIR